MARPKEKERSNGSRNKKVPKRSWHEDLEPATKRSIVAVIFFVLAAVTLFAYWGRAGFLGNLIYQGIGALVGNGLPFFLAPITFLGIAGSLLFAFRRHLFSATFVGGSLFLVSALALIELFFHNRAGGWIGFAANWPVERALDFWPTFLIELAALVVSVLIVTNLPLWKPHEQSEEGTEVHALTKMAGAVAESVAAVKEIAKREEVAPMAGKSSVMVESVETKRAGGDDEFTVAKKRMARSAYVYPPLSLLNDDKGTPSSGDIRANANIIKRTLLNFGIDVEMGEVSVGPTVTQYTLKPAEGVKLARIVALQSDLSLALAAHPIRLEAPIPGKSLVGIEVPNRSIALVGLRSLLENEIYQNSEAPLLFVLGRDVAGAPVYANLAKMPHLLVAGSTGAGKSVAIHSMITSFLYRNPPDLLKFLIIDPKRVELSTYSGIPHLLTPPITDSKKTIQALRWAVKEMDKRYETLASAGVRDLASYNERIAKKVTKPETEARVARSIGEADGSREPMPYIVIIIDELADLMVSFPREVEASIIRLAQMARAVGIHLVVATQRPSVEVITGLIKANITSRIAFQVASQIDSRTILDVAGADKLLGNGDMLFLAGDTAKPRRIQGGFVSESEVQRIVKFVRDQGDAIPQTPEGEAAAEDIFSRQIEDAMAGGFGDDDFEGDDDPRYEEARKTVVQAGKASASYLQRRLKIGYARAARLLDILEERGVIGPGEGAKPREILARDDAEGQT